MATQHETWRRVKAVAREACEGKRAEEDLWSRGKGRARKESRIWRKEGGRGKLWMQLVEACEGRPRWKTGW